MLKQAGKVRKLILDNKEYVLVARAHWEAVTGGRPSPKTHRTKLVTKQAVGLSIEDVRRSLAERVVSQRTAAGMTQQELARRAGVRVETISRLENGLHTPGARTFAKIERALTRRRAT